MIVVHRKRFVVVSLRLKKGQLLYFILLFQAGLHDVIMKNLDKIKKPRTQNAHNMY